ncbi:MAG: SOS response-associated peptidase [Bacteroidia bacterium]|nr:SOS response-associated peptidase [Bacteroidia bacterium]
MCYYSKQSKDAIQLQARFNVTIEPDMNLTYHRSNGFTYPPLPVITNAMCGAVQLYNWGLIPTWAKDLSFRRNTLNARIETVTELASFRSSVNNRCLVPADGFYEWKWLDAKGKTKQQFLLSLPDDELFAFAGIYNQWTDRSTGEILNTFSIVTTEANELMSEIHHTKKRMPVILTPGNEKQWLNGANMLDFAKPEIDLIAREIKVY